MPRFLKIVVFVCFSSLHLAQGHASPAKPGSALNYKGERFQFSLIYKNYRARYEGISLSPNEVEIRYQRFPKDKKSIKMERKKILSIATVQAALDPYLSAKKEKNTGSCIGAGQVWVFGKNDDQPVKYCGTSKQDKKLQHAWSALSFALAQ